MGFLLVVHRVGGDVAYDEHASFAGAQVGNEVDFAGVADVGDPLKAGDAGATLPKPQVG